MCIFIANIIGTLACLFPLGLNGNSSDTGCKELTRSDYLHILWISFADFPGKLLPLKTLYQPVCWLQARSGVL